GWAPELLELVTRGETTPVGTPDLGTTAGTHLGPRPGHHVCIGDAAHLHPARRRRRKLGLYDGAQLAQAIAATPADIDTAFNAFAEQMLPAAPRPRPRATSPSSKPSATTHPRTCAT
ncbi:hypothetical protein ACRAWF_23035, partial [Streptomyces sp. L7]